MVSISVTATSEYRRRGMGAYILADGHSLVVGAVIIAICITFPLWGGIGLMGMFLALIPLCRVQGGCTLHEHATIICVRDKCLFGCMACMP